MSTVTGLQQQVIDAQSVISQLQQDLAGKTQK
jgi:hypothetical protein